jgi:MraZ protein
MSSFKGSYSYSVDSKGRINIPARMRKNLSPEANNLFIVTRGYESCLFLYPNDEWIKVEQALRQLSPADPRHRFVTRTLLQYATESQLDGQFRIIIPKELLQFAKIENEVLILGMLERIEVWDPKVYNEYMATQSQNESYESVAATVFKPPPE